MISFQEKLEMDGRLKKWKTLDKRSVQQSHNKGQPSSATDGQTDEAGYIGPAEGQGGSNKLPNELKTILMSNTCHICMCLKINVCIQNWAHIRYISY